MSDFRRWMLALLFCCPLCNGASADVDTRCIEEGGPALCTQPMPGPSTPGLPIDRDMWTYNLCDMDGVFLSREAAWCKAKGGTWGPAGCAGASPLDGEGLAGTALEFEKIVNDPCQIQMQSSGWGQTIPSNILCWSGAPLSRNGALIRDFQRFGFNGLKTVTTCNTPWSDVVYAGRWRAVVCPESYNTRTKANGDLECWKLPPDCPKNASNATKAPATTIGNPIVLLDGCKAQREVDYPARTRGGLELVRYYNSGGYFRFDAAPKKASDVWRTNWDRRILAPPASTSVLAYAQREDGSVLAFLPSGKELHNNRGGGAGMLQRLTNDAGATTGWLLATDDGDVERYDATGRLLSLMPRTGRGFALAYDASGRLASVTDVFGRTLAFRYDAAGRRSGFTAPSGASWSWNHDELGRLVKVSHPDGTARAYHYENLSFVHALTGITDENGQRFASWTYDSAGRATTSQHAGGADAVRLNYGPFSTSANEGSTAVTDGFGTLRSYYYQAVGGVLRIKRITQPCPGCNGTNAIYTYDANGNIATYKDFNGNQTTYTYDLARNLEIARTEAAGTPLARTITTQWHPTYRLPIRITAPSGIPNVGEVTELSYDAQGNLLQKTITAGATTRQWTSTYSALGQVLSSDGPRADVADRTTYAYYDAADDCIGCRGNLRTITDAAGQVTSLDGYDADGALVRSTDANGVVTTLDYDVRGRLRARTINAGRADAETTMFDYDGVGKLVRVTMPDGSFVRYQYDAAHRLTEIGDAGGNVIQYTLDAMGNRIKEDVYDAADRMSKTRQRIYDSLGRRYHDIGGNGQLWTYGYDGNGNLSVATDPLSRTQRQSFDALDRLSSITDATGAVTQYAYDAKDRLVSVRDPVDATTAYGYDGLGNLIRSSSPDSGFASYVFDAAGNVVAATDARGVSTAYAYDALNRPTTMTFSGGSIGFEYDNATLGGAYAKGRLTRLVDPSGSTTFAYDAAGRVVAKTAIVAGDGKAPALTVRYQYSAGRLAAVSYPSGRVASYGFDAQGRVSALTFAGSSILSRVAYFPFGGVQGWTWSNGQSYQREFDNDGRIVALTLGPDTLRNGDERWAFGYDAVNRLTTAALPSGQTLAYSYDANGNRKRETSGAAVTDYAYAPASNRLQSLSGSTTRTFAYDAAGNVIANGGATFSYDGRGRMAQASSGHRYAVNGFGQRVLKAGPGVTTGMNYYVYDEGGRLIGEYDATGAVREEIVYLGDLPVASVRSSAKGGVDVFLIYGDHLGTPRMVTDQSNRVVWEWKTDTFGAGSPNEDPSGLGPFPFNLRFPGQYYDAETGLHYNYFRDYDPRVGRYVESDPIGLRAGLNLYQYADSEPQTKTDPLGLATYMCKRPLDHVPFIFGPLYHEYLCTGNSRDGFSCGGLGPRTGHIFDGPGMIEIDKMKPPGCRLTYDDNDCIEKCIQGAFKKPAPNYSVDLSHGDNCQTFATGTLNDCVAGCNVKKK